MKKSSLLLIFSLGLFFSCQKKDPQNKTDDSTYEKLFRQAVSTLASDDFKGRKPFTQGEELTLNYLEEQFKAIGLQPGNGDSYFQEVPMVDIFSTIKEDKISVKGKKGSLSFEPLTEIAGGTKRVVKTQEIADAPMIFAGFGIDAPEYDWNDFEGMDVKGKVIVVLVNDPGYYHSELFRGKNMTYYGRWTYKFEEAARQGAAGVLIIHATAPASYGWGVVRSHWSRSNLYMESKDGNKDAAALDGWISADAAQKLFDFAGLDLGKLTEEAKQPGFKAVPLNLTFSTTLENTIDRKVSKNVAAVLPGSDLKDEYLIYSAHWDHLGVGEPIEGDSIYNGAADNASGTAGLLTLAKMFKAAPQNRRSILFLSVTAEEQGLLGSEYYTQNPLFPLSKTVADINMDVLQPFGKMNDIFLIGMGQSNIDNYLIEAADKVNRKVHAPKDQSNGWYYRSDHFNFAKAGIPTLYIANGEESIEHGTAWGQKQIEEYNTYRYHKPQDEYSEDWDISGILSDLKLIYSAGHKLANTEEFPTWNDGVMYKKIREQSLRQ